MFALNDNNFSHLVVELICCLKMPSCTVYDGKPCRSNYDETKNILHEKVTTYSFPDDPAEHELRIKSLPNVLVKRLVKSQKILAFVKSIFHQIVHK